MWDDKKNAVYSDNEMTNKQGYRATHTHMHVHKHTHTHTHIHHTHTHTHTHTHISLMPSRKSRTVPVWRIMCAEACLASMLVMDSVRLARLARLAPSPQIGVICQPTRCQQRQCYKYLTLGELCLYAPSKWGQGQNNGVREMLFPLQLSAS